MILAGSPGRRCTAQKMRNEAINRIRGSIRIFRTRYDLTRSHPQDSESVPIKFHPSAWKQAQAFYFRPAVKSSQITGIIKQDVRRIVGDDLLRLTVELYALGGIKLFGRGVE